MEPLMILIGIAAVAVLSLIGSRILVKTLNK